MPTAGRAPGGVKPDHEYVAFLTYNMPPWQTSQRIAQGRIGSKTDYLVPNPIERVITSFMISLVPP
jgi:hypothetical protein